MSTLKSIPESSSVTTTDISIYSNYPEKQSFSSPPVDLATISGSAACRVSPEICLGVFQIDLNFHIHK